MRCVSVVGDGRRALLVTYEAAGRRFDDVMMQTWSKWAGRAEVSNYGPRVRVDRDAAGIIYAYGHTWAPCPDRLLVTEEGDGWRVSLR